MFPFGGEKTSSGHGGSETAGLVLCWLQPRGSDLPQLALCFQRRERTAYSEDVLETKFNWCFGEAFLPVDCRKKSESYGDQPPRSNSAFLSNPTGSVTQSAEETTA